MIPQKTVQEILETAKIEEVVGDFVNLKRRGVNMIGLCPFHNEKTPSFIVSPNKNIFKCFGCGQAGNSTKFIMEHENMSFPEALRWLARKYGIEIKEREITPEMRAEMQMEESLFLVNDYALKYFQDTLFNTDLGKSVGLNYFKSRGFREETIKKWGLGFTLDQKTRFTVQAKKDGYNEEKLKKLGLTSRYGQDFFRNRVMFTIRNLSGKVVGFAGRIMAKDVKAPKYINSPETEIYNKSKTLYGLYFAKKAIRKNDECILVEGYTDVISLHQAGIENVVASSGTSLTVEQITIIKSNTQNLTILYDGDAAGFKAASRGLKLVLAKDINVRVCLLPEGEDPDSFINKIGTKDFLKFKSENSKELIEFLSDFYVDLGKNDPLKKSKGMSEVSEFISVIKDKLKRDEFVRLVSFKFNVSEIAIHHEINKFIRIDIKRSVVKKEQDKRRQQNKDKKQEEQVEGVELGLDGSRLLTKTLDDIFQERDIARILVLAGDKVFDQEENITVAEYILSNIEDVIEDFDNSTFKLIVNECLNLVLDKKSITREYFTNHQNELISKSVIDLIHTPYEYSPGWEERDVFLQSQKKPEDNFTKDSLSALKRFKLKKVIKMCDTNAERLKKMKEAGENDPIKIMRVMKVQHRLNEMRNQLAAELGTVVLKSRG